jgi:hypothetical protein
MRTKLKSYSASNQAPSQPKKPTTSLASSRLTASEIEALRQNKKDGAAFYQRAFQKARR